MGIPGLNKIAMLLTSSIEFGVAAATMFMFPEIMGLSFITTARNGPNTICSYISSKRLVKVFG